MTLTPPPQWSEIGNLLRLDIVIYVGLVILALINATIRRCTLRRLLPTEPFSTSVLQPQFAQRYRENLSNYSFHISVFRLLLAFFVCVSGVCFTYIGVISPYLWYTLKSIGAILFAYVISVIATADRPISVVANILAFAEVLSLLPTIFAQPTDWLNFAFLQACSIMTSYFTLESAIDVYFNFKSSQVQRQLVRLTVQFFMFIYIFACGLQLLEHLGEPWVSLSATTFGLTLANSFYFTVATLFTVGYGDFVPFTLLGRLWIIFIIVFGAYIITRKIWQVVDVVSDLRRGCGSFVKAEGTDHCVICGHVKCEYLKASCRGFMRMSATTIKSLLSYVTNRTGLKTPGANSLPLLPGSVGMSHISNVLVLPKKSLSVLRSRLPGLSSCFATNITQTPTQKTLRCLSVF